MSEYPPAADNHRIDEILKVMRKLGRGDLSARGTPSKCGDGLDTVIAGLNDLAEQLNASSMARRTAEEALERTHRELEHEVRERTEALSRKTRHLERVNDELQQFTYVVSHDLKAPLRAIANLVTWLEEDLGPLLSPENRKQMDLLRMRVQRMHKLIDALLEYSRAGSTAGPSQRVDVGALVSEVVHSHSMPPTFTVHIQPRMPVLITHRLPLRQVFANLISNAIKHHNRADGNIWITSREVNGWFEFAVEDDGPGIAPQYHQKIFEMFQALTARDQTGHAGVGLALVKKLVEENGGRVEVESESGKGARFRFTWPKAHG